MQILANALPGFRDLRGPVIAGYVWLVFAWLLLAPDLDVAPENGVAATVYDLGERVGRIGIALAISVLAYLLGSVSHEVSAVLARSWRSWERLPDWARGGPRILLEQPARDVWQRGRSVLRGQGASLDSETFQDLENELADRASEADRQAHQELTLPATLLVGDRPELFAEVDRLRAEGELRLDVAPPIAAVGVLLTVAASPWFVLAAPATLILFWQGLRRDAESRRVVADALQMGRIASSSVARFAEWVDRMPDRVRGSTGGTDGTYSGDASPSGRPPG